MEYLTYTERYVDVDENYYLSDVAGSNSSDDADVHLDFNKGSTEVTDSVKTTGLCAPSNYEKVELLSENLSKMIRNFKKCKESCERFLAVYPSWSDKRKNVIAQLKEISEDLDKIKWDSNVAKLVGSSVGVAGGILAVVGCALIPFTAGISTPLMIGGVVTSSLGGVTSFGTAVTAMCLLKQKIQAAQEIVMEDKEEFNAMAEFFDQAGEYIHALQDFLGLNSVAKLGNAPELQNLLTSKSKVKTAHTSFPSTIAKFSEFEAPGIRKKVLDVAKTILPRTLHGFAVPLSVVIAILSNPNLFKLFQEIKQLHFDNPVMYEIITMIYRIDFLQLADMQANCITCVNTAAKFGGITVTATVGQALSQTLFASLSLAIDVMSLTLTSIDFHKGSHCQSAESVRKVNKQLSHEFDIIKSVYSELHKCEMSKDI